MLSENVRNIFLALSSLWSKRVSRTTKFVGKQEKEADEGLREVRKEQSGGDVSLEYPVLRQGALEFGIRIEIVWNI